MAMNVNTLESYFPVPSVQHPDETIGSSVKQLSALNSNTRLVLLSPSVGVRITFDGTDPAEDGRGHLYGAGSMLSVNEVTAAAIKWVKAYSDDVDGDMTVTEFMRTA